MDIQTLLKFIIIVCFIARALPSSIAFVSIWLPSVDIHEEYRLPRYPLFIQCSAAFLLLPSRIFRTASNVSYHVTDLSVSSCANMFIKLSFPFTFSLIKCFIYPCYLRHTLSVTHFKCSNILC